MPTVEWSDAADNDLWAAWLHIAEDNSHEVADAVTDAVMDKADTLTRFPKSGELQTGYRRPVRRIVSGPFNIFYSVLDDVVVIERVLHGAQHSEDHPGSEF